MVDFARRPYKTLARFFSDRPDILIPIQWYRAADDAPGLPFPTSFMSLDWTSGTDTREQPGFYDEPWLQRPGEVFGEIRPYNAFPTPLGLDYSHLCGTPDQFLNGVPYNAALNVQYDEQGLPLCCNGPALPIMGLVVGFDVSVQEPTPLVPGLGCFASTDIPGPGLYSVTVPSASSIFGAWLRFPAGSAHTYRITHVSAENAGVFINCNIHFVPEGMCVGLGFVGDLFVGDHLDFAIDPTGDIYFAFFTFSGTLPSLSVIQIDQLT